MKQVQAGITVYHDIPTGYRLNSFSTLKSSRLSARAYITEVHGDGVLSDSRHMLPSRLSIPTTVRLSHIAPCKLADTMSQCHPEVRCMSSVHEVMKLRRDFP